MASLGHPLVADAVYGGKPMVSMERQALHAFQLAFDHPVSHVPMAFKSQPSVDFCNLLDFLGLSYNGKTGINHLGNEAR